MRFLTENRIRTSREFKAVFDKGKRVSLGLFLLIWMPSTYSCSRLGLVVSRKVGNAVTRNRVKRCMRAAFRLTSCIHQSPIDLVVLARKNCHTLDTEFISKRLTQVFQQR